MVGFERNPFVKMPAQPATVGHALPVDRMLRTHCLTPWPSFLTPQLPSPITVIVHEYSELGLGDGRACEGKWLHLDRVRPLFIVKHKRLIRRGTQEKRATGYFSVT
jgi:hypothetical protein